MPVSGGQSPRLPRPLTRLFGVWGEGGGRLQKTPRPSLPGTREIVDEPVNQRPGLGPGGVPGKTLPGGETHGQQLLPVLHQKAQAAGQRRGISGRDQEAVLPVAGCGRHARQSFRHDRYRQS